MSRLKKFVTSMYTSSFIIRLKEKIDEKILDFINRFDSATDLAKKHNLDLLDKVKGLKLLDDAGSSE